MKKYILAGALIIIVVLAVIGLRGDEDTYLCQNGVWVAHGKPSAPPPTEPCLSSKQLVTLYYYDSSKDTDAEGNILCSKKGLVPVIRPLSATSTDPIADTIRLLLTGKITDAERAMGVTSEFPLPGVMLRSAKNENGTLTLTFDDPNAKTGGGSCRVAILWAQVSETAKQFPGVQTVRFYPEELFQP